MWGDPPPHRLATDGIAQRVDYRRCGGWSQGEDQWCDTRKRPRKPELARPVHFLRHAVLQRSTHLEASFPENEDLSCLPANTCACFALATTAAMPKNSCVTPS